MSKLVQGTIAFDFDGVLSEGGSYHWPLTNLDLELVREAHRRGYAVVIMTCNDIGLVARELQRHELHVYADHTMRYQSWHDPRVVLVTGRKVCATAYVDDRAIRFTYGDDPAMVWDVLDSDHVDEHGCLAKVLVRQSTIREVRRWQGIPFPWER